MLNMRLFIILFSIWLTACGTEEDFGCETVIELQYDVFGNPCTDGQEVVAGCCPVGFIPAGVIDGAAVCIGSP